MIWIIKKVKTVQYFHMEEILYSCEILTNKLQNILKKKLWNETFITLAV